MRSNKRGPRINRIVQNMLALFIPDRVEARIERFVENPRHLIAVME